MLPVDGAVADLDGQKATRGTAMEAGVPFKHDEYWYDTNNTRYDILIAPGVPPTRLEVSRFPNFHVGSRNHRLFSRSPSIP